MRNVIRKWLGLNMLDNDLYRVLLETRALRHDVHTLSLAISRVIAKIDPTYGKPEIDEVRKAESDELGRRVMEKLLGEAAAQRHATGDK